MYTIHVFGSGCDYEMLYFSLVDNLDYFYNCRDKNWYSNGFVNLLREALGHLHWYEEKLSVLYDQANEFDFNSRVHGNGFRSFIIIFERCFTEFYKFNKRLYASRNSFFFRASKYLKEADCLVKILSGLRPALEFLNKMLTNNFDKQLLMPDKIFTAEELIKECEGINQVAFYSRFEGFYYCSSMRRILQGVGVIMATFSDLYQTTGGPISRATLTITNGLKYILNPELRAEQIVDVAQNSSVEFLKSFWQLGESQFMTNLPRWICPKLQVKEEIYISEEPIALKNIQYGNCVIIPVPSSHIPSAPIRCLLLSTYYRKGQNLRSKKKTPSKIEEQSSSLLFHCHGGGFISQSPESHEIYLRHWAKDLNVPIFSVDYSLSPEAPFPRALEEILLAYAWVLKNPDKLGWTGERICFAGDSAGGNMLLGITLRIIELGIRQPDALFCAYSPLVLDLVPSPSRLLCWIDPLLPLGFMLSCLDAYVGTSKNIGDEYDDESNQQNGRRSRKISSSISQILDSSMNFIKNCEWVEVEANEPPVNESNVFCHPDKSSETINEDYIASFIEEYGEFNCIDSSEEIKDPKEFSLYTVPHDIIFDLKSKCQSIVESSLNQLSQIIITSPIYQKIVGPFVPYKGFFEQTQNKLSSLPLRLSIDDKMKNLKLAPRNPFISPLLASNEALKHMPPVYFVSLNFDPCLDDTVTFAKRLKSLGRPVELDVLDGLPHGFLNFLPFSQEAHNGSDVCVRRLKEALKML